MYSNLSKLATLKTQSVRDLAFSCFGPNLIQDLDTFDAAPPSLGCHTFALTSKRLAWLQQLDQHPTPLLNHLSLCKSSRLGLYFESLWQFFVQEDTELTLVAHNLPVYDHKRTLGEFDLIYFCHQQQCYIHVELAVKYYLGLTTHNDRGLHQWIGPNSQDRFDLKLQRLFDHQTQLSFTEAGQRCLKEKCINLLKPQLAMKGWLFYPHNDFSQKKNNHEIKNHPGINKQHSKGQWLHLTDFINWSCSRENTDHTYALVPKRQWLSPVQSHRISSQSINAIHQQLIAHFENYQQAVMLVACNHEGEEENRLFITHDQWPLTYPTPTP